MVKEYEKRFFCILGNDVLNPTSLGGITIKGNIAASPSFSRNPFFDAFNFKAVVRK